MKENSYFECAQIEVGGNGAGTPGPLVKIPGLYDSEDPALRFSIYGAPEYPYTNIGKSIVWPAGAGGNNSTNGTAPRPTSNQSPGPNNDQAPYPTRGGGYHGDDDDEGAEKSPCTNSRRKVRTFRERRAFSA